MAADHDHTEPMLELVGRLTSRLADEGIRYCHWKSNQALERSLSGENDLDLLVARDDARAFRRVLTALGFAQVRPPRSRQVLGLEDHLGWDGSSGRLVHVQPHFELIVGDDMTKSFRLPVEAPFLASAHGTPLPTPSSEWEYLVFVIRMTIKHCPLEAIVARKGRLTRSERAEQQWLEARAEPAAVRDLRRRWLPMISDSAWDRMLAGIGPDAGVVRRAVAGRTILRNLRHSARRAPSVDAALKLVRRARAVTAARSSRPAGKRSLSGGLFVAVIGGDGSGKSSLVEGLVGALAPAMAVRRVHLGKPPRSLLTRIVTRPLRLLRSRGAFAATRMAAWEIHERHPGLVYCLWHWLIARDRLLEYRRARRWAGAGDVVVSDRFPLESLTVMDGPRLAGLPGGGRLARMLAESEAGMYRHIRPPDLMLVLRVPPEVAVSRRPEQDPDFVRRRSSAIWEVDWSSADVVVIDGTLPLVDVRSTAVEAVRRRL